jgi:hypothetical protein
MASGCMIYIPRFMKIGSGIQAILRSVPQQFERPQYLFYSQEGFMKYAVEMTYGGMIYLPSFIDFGSGIQVILKLLP